MHSTPAPSERCSLPYHVEASPVPQETALENDICQEDGLEELAETDRAWAGMVANVLNTDDHIRPWSACFVYPL
jgi:hypothetical protein